MQLTNQTSKPVFFALMEEGFAVRASLAACVDVARCPSLAPGASERVEFDRIAGYSAESERAVLLWWHADGAQDGIQHPERIRTTSVRLR